METNSWTPNMSEKVLSNDLVETRGGRRQSPASCLTHSCRMVACELRQHNNEQVYNFAVGIEE